jgi:outer membrane protein assembly factor BamD
MYDGRESGVKTLAKRISKTGSKRLPFLLCVAVLGGVCLPGCLFHRHRRTDLAAAVNAGDQPDKILYERAVNEIAHGRYDVGRLTLQTLINTYPDSEHLARAKLAIADSYYDEGGVSGLTQSEAEYKDFITFFPTAPEAPEAQYRVGMAHFRLMAKADRDQSEARLAEVEFKEFLLKYPDNAVSVRVKARLRETQEVLAEGEFETASFYLARGAYRAARGRFREVVEKYPNFSGGDLALYGLGQTLEHLKTPKEAIPYYSRVVRDFPLSLRTTEAKDRLVAMGAPVPKPTKATLARAQADAARLHSQSLFGKLSTAMASMPDTSATLRGPVHLGPAEASGVEMAKRTPAAPSLPNAVVAEPVGDAGLNSGKAVDSKPAVDNSDKGASANTPDNNAKPPIINAPPPNNNANPPGSESSSKAPENTVNSSSKESSSKVGESNAKPAPQDQSGADSSAKKKSRFHFLKKVIKPI